RNIAFGRGSTTRPSTSIAPSFLAMSSAFRDGVFFSRAHRHAAPRASGRHDGTGAGRRAVDQVYARATGACRRPRDRAHGVGEQPYSPLGRLGRHRTVAEQDARASGPDVGTLGGVEPPATRD